MSDKTIDIEMAFLMADSMFQNTITAITNIILDSVTENLDFNDLRIVLSKKGKGHLDISTESES